MNRESNERKKSRRLHGDQGDATTRPLWTGRRIAILAWFCLHWLAVMVFSVPDPGWRAPVLGIAAPLPRLNTHEGERGLALARQSVVQWYLACTTQYQRWKMFTPSNPYLSYLLLEYDDPQGGQHAFELVDRIDYWRPRGCRWLFLEDALLNPDRRTTYLPYAAPALVAHFEHDSAVNVRAVKLSLPIPLLKLEPAGPASFSTAADWLRQTRNRANFVRIEMGTFPGGDQEPRD